MVTLPLFENRIYYDLILLTAYFYTDGDFSAGVRLR